MKENLGNVTPVSGNTFKDRHGRTLIGDAKNRRFYIVGKENERIMTILDSRYIIIMAVLVLVGFRFGWVWGAGIGLIVFAISEIYYRKFFLPSLNTIDDVDVPKTKSTFVMTAEDSSPGKNILRGGASVLTALLLLLNMNLNIKDWNEVFSFKDWSLTFLAVFSIVASVFFMYLATISFQALRKNGGKR